jgi:hypothetical protein
MSFLTTLRPRLLNKFSFSSIFNVRLCSQRTRRSFFPATSSFTSSRINNTSLFPSQCHLYRTSTSTRIPTTISSYRALSTAKRPKAESAEEASSIIQQFADEGGKASMIIGAIGVAAAWLLFWDIATSKNNTTPTIHKNRDLPRRQTRIYKSAARREYLQSKVMRSPEEIYGLTERDGVVTYDINLKSTYGLMERVGAMRAKRMGGLPTFYTNKLPPSTNLPNNCFTESVDITIKGIERNKYNHSTGNENTRATCLHELCKSYKLGMCQDCRATLSPERVATEEQEAKRVKDEDLLSVGKQISEDNVDHVKERADARAANGACILDPAREMHAERLMGLGIRISALIAFAYAHDCWDWTTADVVRDIIKPVTREHDRCRYGDIPELKACFGPATVFMSHCWGAKFGDLIGAACHGARTDRIVWIDIFAVRQWPGNVADLDFRSVLGKCDAVVVSTSPVDGLQKYIPMKSDKMAFLATVEGKAAKKATPFFRLWCIVELVAAIVLNVPIVVKGGSVTSSHGIYEYDTQCIGDLMGNLSKMIDVDASECAVQADYDREMAVVHSLEGGSKGVNALVAGVVHGGDESIFFDIFEIDAFVCNEPESFRALNIPFGCEGKKRDLAIDVLRVAGSGGRESVVEELLRKWSVKEDIDQKNCFCDQENCDCDSPRQKEKKKEKKRKWLIQLIDDSKVLWDASSGGHVGVVEMLLEVVGINVNVVNENGCTPLYAASQNGHVDTVKVLLAAKDINVHQVGYGGSTPLDVASYKGHTKVIQMLSYNS